jgi:hypothetical protein
MTDPLIQETSLSQGQTTSAGVVTGASAAPAVVGDAGDRSQAGTLPSGWSVPPAVAEEPGGFPKLWTTLAQPVTKFTQVSSLSVNAVPTAAAVNAYIEIGEYPWIAGAFLSAPAGLGATALAITTVAIGSDWPVGTPVVIFVGATGS